jgi:hypothetical protein
MKKLVMLVMMFALVLVESLVVTAESTSVQPSYQEIKQIITDKAIQNNIPPEIIKAIAFTESGYKQFENGEPYVSSDGGIGIMQITPSKIDFAVDEQKLKYDINYNIEIGAKVLSRKWELTYLPKMNNQDRKVLENWYFPIAAYNGLSKANDPNLNPGSTYQDKVYKRISSASLLMGEGYFVFPKFDIRYEGTNETMKFPEGSSYITQTTTLSQQMYVSGDMVYIDGRDGGTKLRSSSDINSVLRKLLPYTPLTVTGKGVESSKIGNDFIYYPVNGVKIKGYAGSLYLNVANKEFTFTDPIDDDRAAALYFLAMNDYVSGYKDGSFGSNKFLKREHVAVILDRILDMSKPSNYQMKAKDVAKNNEYYEQLAEAEYNGYLGVGGKIRPKEYLTRSQMASILVRAFDENYNTPKTNHVFKDQKSIWNYEPINTLYYNEVTVADPFLPNNNVTRSQFALFIYRTMVDY